MTTTTTQVGHDSATPFSLGTFNHAGLEKLTQAFLDDLPPPLSITVALGGCKLETITDL
jgi:hypothetical protein